MGDAAVVLERSYAFDPVPVSARAARHFLRGLLIEAGREEWSEAAELALTEIVTNAVLHAHTPLTVTARLTRRELLVEVLDHNPVLPSQRRYDVEATTGRGMDLVAAVAPSHGVTPLGADGKVVWFRLGAVPEAPSVEDLLDAWDDEAPVVAPVAGALRVVLLGMPPTLWLAAREHHDAILREYALHRAEHGPGAGEAADLALADEARSIVCGALERAVHEARDQGRATRPLPPGHPSLLADAPPTLDLELTVAPERAGAFGALQDALDAAERLAAADLLLVRPALPEVVAVRDWACEQVISQARGGTPSPWIGAGDERFTTEAPRGGPALLAWDTSLVREAERGVVAVDDANRIVALSRPLAAALGWAVDDLVGRRVIAVIPHRFREAHVAGFTRHLSTGESHVIGVPLELPALRADGTEVACRLFIEQATVAAGRSGYIAWVDPLDGP